MAAAANNDDALKENQSSDQQNHSTPNGTSHEHATCNGSDHVHDENAPKEEKKDGEGDEAGQPLDGVFKLTVELPHHPKEIETTVSSQEQIQDVRQSVVDQPHTFQYSCFHFEHKGKRISDFVEVSEIKDLAQEPRIKLVEDPYTEAQARMHVVRVRELIGAAGNRIDLVSGIDAGTSLCEGVELPAGKQGRDESSPIAHYDLNAPAPISILVPKQLDDGPPKTVKSISLSPWNPPPYHLRMRGHLLYLQVTTLEGEQYHLTSHVTGFYVNRSTNAKFDPARRSGAPKDIHAHSLITLLTQLSPEFGPAFRRLQEYNGKKDPLASYQLSNCIPAAPWLIGPASAQQHQADLTRTQEPYLLAGADNAETLRDWNEEFQSTRELPKETVQERVFRERLTSKLFAEYNEAAIRGAVLVGRGEVQPLNPTEARDAQIFVYNNVFYSFGADGVGTFTGSGGDEAARVATGKDVQGVKAVNQLDINGLFTAGTVVVDYLGKRIVGQSIVPGIFKQRDPGENQIDYGGVEGKDIIASHESFVQPFAELSKAMRVKRHAVWDKELKRHELEGSVETKGLLGTDGRKYVLDLYRVTPLDVAWLEQHCGDEVEEEKRYPHKMAVLRPELVESFRHFRLRQYAARELEKKKLGKTTDNDTKVITNGEAEAAKTNGELAESAEKAEDGETKGDAANDAPKQQETVDISDFEFALNPDVFSGQQPQTDEEKAEMEADEAEVRAACKHLTDEVIPRLVHDMQEGEVGFPMDGQNLVRDMHKRGVNARYLGAIARLCEQKDAQDKRLEALKALAIQEMVARSFKHFCNKMLKNLPPVFAHSCVAHLLNCLLGSDLTESPQAELDEETKVMYPDVDLAFEQVTPDSLKTELKRQIFLRYRYDIASDSALVQKGKELQMLREICMKLGLQLEAKDYQFTKESASAQSQSTPALQQKSSMDSLEVPQTNGAHHSSESTSGSKKKKKKHADQSPNRAATPVLPLQTFHAENVLNIVPIVKEASPRSVLAEEALDAGRMSIQQNQKDLGQELLLESLSLHEQIYGILHPEVARVYYALSTLYYGLDEKNAAVELAKKAVIVSERTLGVDNAETILAYLNWSLMEHATGHTRNALALVRHALDLWKIVYGTRHPDSITTINNAAVMLQTLKQFHESRMWFESSLEICEEVAGRDSVNTATLLFQYAQSLALDQDSRGAMKEMKASYEIFEKLLGPENQNTKEAKTWWETLTSSAVNQAKAAQQASSLLASGGAANRRMLFRSNGARAAAAAARMGLGQRPQPPAASGNGAAGAGAGAGAGAAGAQTDVVSTTAAAGGRTLDQRSLDELVRYVNGEKSGSAASKTSTPKKKAANPKRRQGQGQARA